VAHYEGDSDDRKMKCFVFVILAALSEGKNMTIELLYNKLFCVLPVRISPSHQQTSTIYLTISSSIFIQISQFSKES